MKLVPVNLGGPLAEASVTTISFQMDKRIRRPYPPSEMSLNGTAWDDTAVSLEANGSGPEDYHVDVDWLRRDYRVADDPANISELDQLSTDAETLYSGFVAATSHDMNIEVRHDPTGTNDLILNVTGQSGTNYGLNRIDILDALGGAVPTGDIRVSLTSRHVDNSETLTARQTLHFDFAISSALTGLFEFGALTAGVGSASYTIATTATHTFTLSSAFASSLVQYRVDTGGGFGSWTTVIAAAATSGTVAFNSGDIVEVRWTAGDTGILKQLTLSDGTPGTDVAFAIFT